MSSEEIQLFRNRKVGFVSQFNDLLAELTALENVLLAAKKAGQEERRKAFAESLLSQFGLGRRGDLRVPYSSSEKTFSVIFQNFSCFRAITNEGNRKSLWYLITSRGDVISMASSGRRKCERRKLMLNFLIDEGLLKKCASLTYWPS
jgi:hypothetical protein